LTILLPTSPSDEKPKMVSLMFNLLPFISFLIKAFRVGTFSSEGPWLNWGISFYLCFNFFNGIYCFFCTIIGICPLGLLFQLFQASM
jgi:hypothetical protein